MQTSPSPDFDSEHSPWDFPLYKVDRKMRIERLYLYAFFCSSDLTKINFFSFYFIFYFYFLIFFHSPRSRSREHDRDDSRLHASNDKKPSSSWYNMTPYGKHGSGDKYKGLLK